MKSIFTSLFILVSFNIAAQLMRQGQWGGNIHYDDADVALTLQVSYPNGEIPEITFSNGAEKRIVSSVQIQGDSIFIPLEPFDVEIRAKFTATNLVGVYKKYYRHLTIPISARFGVPRISKKSIIPSISIKERWAITFSPRTNSESKGVGLFEQHGDRVTGTIMTEVSDYRYFEGIIDGDSIKLSCFDGAHAFAYLGKRINKKWKGSMIYGSGSSEPWEAVYDENATLEDPFEMIKIEAGIYKPYYDLLGAGQGANAIDPSEYKDKILIIQLFGTWCPNSDDQTNYLVEWHKTNKHKDIAILAVSFEANYSQEYGLERLEKYRKTNKIPYDLVLGGRLSKVGAATPFPFMKRIKAFPTLVILDKNGYVRHVNSYFNGPATGEYYQNFDQKFNEIIETLLNE